MFYDSIRHPKCHPLEACGRRLSLSLSRWLLNIVVAGRATPAQETIGVPKGMDKWLTPLQWLAVHKRPQSNEGNMAMTLPALEALPADVCRYTHRPDDPIWSFFLCVRVGGPCDFAVGFIFPRPPLSLAVLDPDA